MKTAQQLIDEGYIQISRKYLRVAKIPDGSTALQALEERAPHEAHRLRIMLERLARDSLLRVYNKGLVEELDQETFNEFKRLGGEAC